MDSYVTDKQVARLSKLLADLFMIDAVYPHINRIEFSLSFRYDRARSLGLLRDRLRLDGYSFNVNDSGSGPILLAVDPARRFRVPPVNIVLFLITLFSVYVVPVFLRNLPNAMLRAIPPGTNGSLSWIDELRVLASAFPSTWVATLADLRSGRGIEFTIGIISILFVHEMGHFIASRRRGIITSWPYFIPAPNIIGTFGAIIKSKSPFWNRRDLIEVGAAGPIAGWIVAIGWLLYGLAHSQILAANQFGLGDLAFSLEGESMVVSVMTPLLAGQAPAGHFYLFTEAAFAGWVGMLVTAINMLPIGQLDGGHILFGLVRRRQRVLGWLAMIGLVALGFQSPVWWFFAAFGLIFKVAHPPTIDDDLPPSRASVIMGVTALIILVISFTPVPFR